MKAVAEVVGTHALLAGFPATQNVAAADKLTVTRLTLGAVSMAAGIGGMHCIGMAALVLAPGIRWNWTLVPTGAAAAALLIFFWRLR